MVKEQVHYRDRIVTDPAILAGKSVVKRTRIPVDLVLAKLAHSPDLEELLADYPRLTVEDVKACLEYAMVLVADHGRAKRLADVLVR